MALHLTDEDARRLDGGDGPAIRLAMRVVVRLAEALGAEELLDISAAHVDSCMYHGRAPLEFAERLAADGATVVVPTTLNASSLDLLHPDLYRGDPEEGLLARRLMDAYVGMGCRPTWTCAPYQLEERPAFGEQIAWAESNAIAFANSVLGARTDRYGDFVDICAAVTGRAPAAGLHLDENRLATIVFRLGELTPELYTSSLLPQVLGTLVGSVVGNRVPVIDGVPDPPGEDWLKALGSAAASAGSVGMFHVVGATPEAPTLEVALGGRQPDEVVVVRSDDLRRTRDLLTTAVGSDLATVSLGTPHYSVAEIGRFVEALAGRNVHPTVDVYISTGRGVLDEVEDRGWAEGLRSAGVTIVTDTCTYVTPILRETSRPAMTDSAKWAYYAPGNLGVDVVLASTRECVESAVAGKVVLDDAIWTEGHFDG
ncbi:MAG: aconitase X catalytic domain-containing protein [Acidimicrobiales bacterium]|nr:aconitase X catalytic domain-containing protein [Acidimicrobiales bacterium]